MATEKVKSGIQGLDELLLGGIPKSGSVLVSGSSGTCKTIFCTQYLYNGAKMYNEPGIYVTLESNEKEIGWNMASFNWDIKKMQDSGLMKIYRLDLGYETKERILDERIRNELETITSMVKSMNAKRLVVDSTTAFGLWLRDANLRLMLYEFTDALMSIGCTTLLTSDTRNIKTEFSAFGFEEFVVDGVIALYFTPPNRSVFVRKMRGTDHSKYLHPFEIKQNGVVISSKEQVSWEAIR